MAGMDVEFNTKNDVIKAYLSRPDDGMRHPDIVVIHEIFGLDDHIRSVADRISREGYVALAPDLFSSHELSAKITREGILESMKFIMSIPPEKQRDDSYRNSLLNSMPEEKRRIMSSTYSALFVNRPTQLLTEYLEYAVDYLKGIGVTSVGSVGFCFGGGMSANLGCTGKVDATVIFYGENPDPIDKVKGMKSVLGLYAGEDHRITSRVPELLAKLIEFSIPVTIKVYPGAYHAFFNDTRPQIYNEAAAKDAWNMMLYFFRTQLGP